jgi:hypothetical protein
MIVLGAAMKIQNEGLQWYVSGTCRWLTDQTQEWGDEQRESRGRAPCGDGVSYVAVTARLCSAEERATLAS